MTKFMMDASGNPDYMTETEAKAWYHSFARRYTPFLFWVIISDWVLEQVSNDPLAVYCLLLWTFRVTSTRPGMV